MNTSGTRVSMLKGRTRRCVGLFLLAASAVFLLEGAARLADRMWKFSVPVRWVVNTLVPENVVSGKSTSLFDSDDALAIRIPSVARADAKPYVLGGTVITGAVEDVEWAWVDNKVVHDGYSVAVLGGSAAFGYPYAYEKSFSSVLHDRLRNKGFRFSNLAKPGMNSGDVRVVMDRVYQWIDPDALVIMMGNNEFIRWQPSWPSSLSGSVWSMMSRMTSSRLVCAALYFKFNRMQAVERKQNKDDGFRLHAELTGYDYASKQIIEKRNDWDQGHWRETRDAYLRRFESNLSIIIQHAHARGVKVFLLTVPVRHKLSPAWKHPQPLGGETSDVQRFESMMADFNGAMDKEQYDVADAIAGRMIERWPESPIPAYLKGVVADLPGDYANAVLYYTRSRGLMVGNLGSMVSVNDVIRSVAEKESAVLVDIERIFVEDSLHAGVVDLYMDDDCHPNESGHRRIASVLEKYFAETD